MLASARAQALRLVHPRLSQTNRRGLEVDGALGVEDEVEEAAVGVVALELDVESGRVLERLGSGRQTGLDVIGRLNHARRPLVAVVHAILVLLLLLPVLGNEGLLLNIAVVVASAGGRRAVLVGAHGGGYG